MFLKSIEIQGFKSFPDKTLLHFGRGITAIVGPNGSGKSNIVDAIRWVLGEQSTKTLRGGKMEDVIFGGTNRRSPLGFCEVTLTLDNADGSIPLDYAEISVTRRYYRSGESEFYLNRKAVRLKDIHELFMDTGLGRDGYSVIGQGRIDEILSVKSADRREIFEEAAGITKFRYRKEESERKLKACEENLVRIRDIITELEGQVAPLKNQAEKAKNWLIYRDELRGLEVTVWLDSLEKLKDSLQKAQVDYANAERMLSARKGELEAMEEQSQAITDRMHEKDVQAEALREEQRQAERLESELRSQIAVNRTHVQNNEDNIAAKMRELEQQDAQGESLESQRKSKLDRAEELLQKDAQLQEELDALFRQVQQAAETSRDLQTRLDALDAQIGLKRQAMQEAQAAAGALESGMEEIAARGAHIEEDLAQQEEKLEQEKQKARALRKEIEENEDKESSAENMLRGFALREKARAEKVQSLSETLQQGQRQLDLKTQRLDMLRAMEREYEGFSQSVRRVMQASQRGELQGVHGPLSSLIRVSDRESVAVEIALGAAMQNIVVDTEQDAKAAIGYLKRHDYGRATFLPLTAVKGRGGNRRDLEGQPGFVGWADDLVTYDGKYERIISSLLAGTAVAEHIDAAIAIAKKNGYSFRIVTLDGQLINPSGAMTGGSLNKNTGVLSRANEISRLEEETKTLQARCEQAEKTLRAAKQELESSLYESNVAKEELRAAQDALLRLRAEQSQHKALMDAIRGHIEDLETEQETQGSRIAAAKQAASEKRREAQGYGEEAAKLEAQAAELAGGRREEEDRTGKLTGQITALREAQVAAKAERESALSSARELEALMASMQGEMESKEQVIDAIRQRNAELRGLIQQQEALAQDHAKTAEEKKARLQNIQNERLQLEGKRASLSREIQSKNNELINLERERGRLENKKTQAEMEEDSILQKLWDNYELTRVTGKDVRVEIESTAAANRRIGELRGAMKKLGSVNLDAIEEYEKVSQRFEFLSAQRDDLEKAKADLLNVIGDLTKNMKEIFGTQFAKINEAFGRTFVEIFGGGSAALRLEDESDILNCGIEIRVELPGKSMRAISLLSGGEKAFVAIALYFAILKVRPTPFCVLDEIEAALDDVNVQRYAAYMRTLCEQTQFIVITHRRGTMEGSDILYGVTMQEQGVTKLLALNINEVEEHIKEKLS